MATDTVVRDYRSTELRECDISLFRPQPISYAYSIMLVPDCDSEFL